MSVLTTKRNAIPTMTTPLFEQGTVFTPSSMFSTTPVYANTPMYGTKMTSSPSSVWGPSWNTPVFGMEVGTTVPTANILETPVEFLIELAIPGICKEDICIELENSAITVRTENQVPIHVKGSVKHREFSYGTFCRTFELPEFVAVEKIKAVVENGILFIAIPKRGMVSSLRVN